MKTRPQAQASETGGSLRGAGVAVLCAVFFNAVFAVFNAHITAVSPVLVMAGEAVIVAGVWAVILMNVRSLPDVRFSLLYLLLSFCIFVFVSLVQENIFLKSFRDILVLVSFFILGSLVKKSDVILTVKIAAFLVFSFILIEGFFPDLYVSVFQPADYYNATRGIEFRDENALGVYGAALSYSDRFSLRPFEHRLSSLMLEQVSLGNFAVFLCMFFCGFYKSLSVFERFFILAVTLASAVTSDSRLAMGLVLLFMAGAAAFRMAPRYFPLLYMPLIVIASFIALYGTPYAAGSIADNLPGRIGMSVYFLSTMQWEWFLGGSLEDINRAWDSGYAYIIFTQTGIGLAALWIFSSVSIAQRTAEERIYASCLSLFLFLSLLVSASILSIKIASLLWFVAGSFMYRTRNL